MPPRPTQRHTISMIHEGMETKTLVGHGFVDNPPNDDDNIPIIISYFNAKKQKSKKKYMDKCMTCIWMYIDVYMDYLIMLQCFYVYIF